MMPFLASIQGMGGICWDWILELFSIEVEMIHCNLNITFRRPKTYLRQNWSESKNYKITIETRNKK